MRAANILETIGNTPHVRINRLFANLAPPGVEVWMKLERANPGGSVQDRLGAALIEDAERRGDLRDGGVIVGVASSEAGIGLAIAAAVKGYRLILAVPESTSLERRRIMRAYGAVLEPTPGDVGVPGAIARAEEIAARTPGAWMPRHVENPAIAEIHRLTTAQEILRDFPDGIDYLVVGAGTGGLLIGVSEVLKEFMPRLVTLAVECVGVGVELANVNGAAIDGVVQVSEADAFAYTTRAAREEGMLVGPSSGASLAAVAATVPKVHEGSRVLTFGYDGGEGYLPAEVLA
jgi:cysteine synthase A